MKVCLGGSFNVIHRGHLTIFKAASSLGCRVVVGLCSDRMADKGYLTPFEERKRNVASALESVGCSDYEIRELDDIYSPGLARPGVNDNLSEVRYIIVSDETLSTAEKLNEERTKNGLGPLEVIVVPVVLAYDSLPISTRRVHGREIDAEGRKDLSIGIGSSNKAKVRAIAKVYRSVFSGVKVELETVEVRGAVAQPKGKETIKGAVARAKKALGERDYGVGVEAGVFETDEGLFSTQYCAIVDQKGSVTVGHGPGFACPPEVAYLITNQGMTMAKAFELNYGITKETVRSIGAIGVMTKGHVERGDLTEYAVYAALAPRIHRMSPAVGRHEK
jgi:inosine/xanthosine triphosphatase